jgi:hypothetical protein
MEQFKVGDFVRIKDLSIEKYPVRDMYIHRGKEGRITGFDRGRVRLCIRTGWVWRPYLLEKVDD